MTDVEHETVVASRAKVLRTGLVDVRQLAARVQARRLEGVRE